MAEKSIRATFHVGPFPGLSHVKWDATIGRVTVADPYSGIALHLFPDAAYALAVELVAAADQATGQTRRYDLRQLITDNVLDLLPHEDDRYDSPTSLVEQLGGRDE